MGVWSRSGAPRVMFYCHDSYGLGHLRRTLALATHLRAHAPTMSQLIVTGSPVAHQFPLPEGADYVKLPAVVKVGAEAYAARSLALPFHAIRDCRRDIALSAARHFRPDALIVDHVPAGLKGELVATLRHLKRHSPGTRLVLGLRDIIDDAPHVRAVWAKEGIYPLLDSLYDLILVYGYRELYDVVAEYGLPPDAARKTRYVGYLRREPGRRSPAEVRAELGLRTDRLVVVTAGGGGDGQALFRATLAALAARPTPHRFDCLVVGGPLLPSSDRAELHGLVGDGATVHFLDFAEDMASYLGAADAVVSMGGYNTICEILSLGRPAIVVPRAAPRQEQLLRAAALNRRGLVRMIHPAELTPGRLLGEIEWLLANPSTPPPLAMDGLPAVAAELDRLLPRTARLAAGAA